MRKVIFATAIFGVLMVSCAKNEIPEKEEEQVTAPTDAEIVEGVMSQSLSAFTEQMNCLSTGIGVASEFFTVAIPENGIQGLIEPIAEQIWNCWGWDGLKFGLSDISGHFDGSFETWKYTEADDLQFTYEGSSGEQDKIRILASQEVTDSPIYEDWPIYITMPQEIKTEVSIDDKEIINTVVNSKYVTDGSTTSAEFKVAFTTPSPNISTADVKVELESESLDGLEINYAINDNSGNELFKINYDYNLLIFDQIDITMGGRVEIIASTANVATYVAALVACNRSLRNDQSKDNVRSIKNIIDSLNYVSDIDFYLDDEEEGNITLALLQDNGIYKVDAVMRYADDGTIYQIPELVSSMSDLYENIDTIIDFTKRIIDYISGYIKDEINTTNS